MSASTDVELFSGAGGLAIGLRAAGFSFCHYYELDSWSCQTLRTNVGEKGTLRGKVHEQDVRKQEWRDEHRSVRLLAAGAPCQAFSIGGKHRADEDERNLFPELLRAVRALMPAAVLVENVKGLRRTGFQPYFDHVIRALASPSISLRPDESWSDHDARIQQHRTSKSFAAEYNVDWRLVNAADYGVPQHRERVFIVAVRADKGTFEFPKPTHSRAALVRARATEAYWESRGIKRKPIPVPEGEPESDDGLKPWVTVRDELDGLWNAADDEERATANHWRIPGARLYTRHTGSALDWPSKTIKAGVHGVPGGENIVVGDNGKHRYYTLREAARIQTFPDDHIFLGSRSRITRQIGNAVPCRLGEAVARPLHALLNGSNGNGSH